MVMMSSFHDATEMNGSASLNCINGHKSAGMSTSPVCRGESKSTEGYINSVIRRLTEASESINGTSAHSVDENVDSSLDTDRMTSSVSVAALRGRFEAVSSLIDSISKKQTSNSFSKDVCDANSNSLVVKSSKSDMVITNANNEGEEEQIPLTIRPDNETVIIDVQGTEVQTVNSLLPNGIMDIDIGTGMVKKTEGGMLEDTTGGETTEDTTADVTSSSDDELEDYELECKLFMKDLVRRIFHESRSITQVDNQKFDQYCRTAEGRKWFARLVDGKRIYNKCVAEQTFYRLVQFFAVCLFECKEADDFSPAKHLMNMCFTFYHEQEGIPRNDEDKTHQSYLYSHLSNQKIWRDQRFWTAAFMDSVHSEKKKRMPIGRENWRKQTQEERENTELLHENITFGQLAAFTHNMMHLGLPRSMCEEFVAKQSVIGSLNDFQIEMLFGNISAHYKEEEKVEEDDKLVTSLQKSIKKIKRKIPGIL